jgi:hypothetical protein
MRALSTPNLLQVWEEGRGEPGYRRAILLLAAACPDESLEELSGLSIGSRDTRLLTLREWTFGRRLDSLVACPACAERLELSLDVPDLQVAAPQRRDERFQLAVDDYVVGFRPLNTSDLVEAARYAEDERKRGVLLERCVVDARQDSKKTAAGQLPARVFEALASNLAQADPQADIQLPLTCPACDHRWHALFDIVSFFWSEIHAWAIRIVREVHLLARTYGWGEADILSMSPTRRQLYLELAIG